MLNWVRRRVPRGIRLCKKRPPSLHLRCTKVGLALVPVRPSPVALLKVPPRLLARRGRVIGDPLPPSLVTGGREDGIIINYVYLTKEKERLHFKMAKGVKECISKK